MDADVIVVGAGPGGASAALHLARAGRHVLLLERHRFPRDKSCGDGLTRLATRLLAEMGVLPHLPASPAMRGVRVVMRGRGDRDFRYPEHLAEPAHGTVVPRVILDRVICEQAVKAGAELWEESLVKRLRYERDRVVGVEVERAGRTTSLQAPVVVAADGAASRLAYQAGLATTPRASVGFAIRGYYEGIEGLTDLLEIYMPLLDVSDRYLLPSYGWVFPISENTANIGVGLVQPEHGTSIRELFTRFLEALGRDPRFRAARPCGPWKGAPLRFDFRPDRCAAPGLLVVGDAAGMISPFTGEGIGYALESGRLAAETIAKAWCTPNDNGLDLSAYGAALGQRFTGYFGTGRASARRFKLVWHVVESTFQNDRPLFHICRRAALFPEGLGESYVERVLQDVTPFVGGDHDPADEHQVGELRADLLAIGELLIDTVRREWPFLAQMLSAEQTVPCIPFRPALLLLLSARIARSDRSLVVPVAAAVELGYLAALAHASVEDTDLRPPGPRSGLNGSLANWGNMFALIVGDFLLSRAYGTSATIAPEVSRSISASLARACEGHVQALRNAYNVDLTPDEHLAIAERKTATLFELPCRLGGQLSDVSARVVEALSRCGRHLGLAHQLIDDVLAASGRASELGSATGSDPREGLYSFPILTVLRSPARSAMKAELARLREGRGSLDAIHAIAREHGGVDASLAAARTMAERAQSALRRVPSGPAQRALHGLTEYVMSRTAGRRS